MFTYSAINCEDKVQLSKCSAVRRNQTTAFILSLYFWRIQSKEEDRTTALIGKQRSCDFGARRVNMIRPSCCEEGKHDPSWKKSTWRGNMTRQSCRIRSDDQSKHDSTKGTLWQQVSNELMMEDELWQIMAAFPFFPYSYEWVSQCHLKMHIGEYVFSLMA